MPIVIASKVVEYYNTDTSRYDIAIDITNMYDMYKHLITDREIETYIIEIINEAGKIIKRFSPFKKVKLRLHIYAMFGVPFQVVLLVPSDIAAQLNMVPGYEVLAIIAKCGGRIFIPFELKAHGDRARKFLEQLTDLDKELLALILELPRLDDIGNYLSDASERLKENDIEGSRRIVGYVLELLEEFISKFEDSEFVRRSRSLIGEIRGFLRYNTSYSGSRSKAMIETAISMTKELIRQLAKAMDEGLVTFKERPEWST